MYSVSWSELKTLADQTNLPVEYVEQSDRYILFLKELGVDSLIRKENPKSSEQTEFETKYKGVRKEATLVRSVEPSIERAQAYVPAAGKKLIIDKFNAQAPYSINSVCKLVWDFGGAGEKVIWIIKGTGSMPMRHVIPVTETNGVRKLAVTCDNAESGDILMGAYLSFWEI